MDYWNSWGGGGGSREERSGGDAKNLETVESTFVIRQLSRVIVGCAHLLRLRGAIGEAEEHALRVMSERGSPALLAAVEAYGANQDLEVRKAWCLCLSCRVSVQCNRLTTLPTAH